MVKDLRHVTLGKTCTWMTKGYLMEKPGRRRTANKN